jgi:hypothetical protein
VTRPTGGHTRVNPAAGAVTPPRTANGMRRAACAPTWALRSPASRSGDQPSGQIGLARGARRTWAGGSGPFSFFAGAGALAFGAVEAAPAAGIRAKGGGAGLSSAAFAATRRVPRVSGRCSASYRCAARRAACCPEVGDVAYLWPTGRLVPCSVMLGHPNGDLFSFFALEVGFDSPP